MTRPSDALHVKTNADKTRTFGQMKYTITGRGIRTSQRMEYTEILRDLIELVDWAAFRREVKSRR